MSYKIKVEEQFVNWQGLLVDEERRGLTIASRIEAVAVASLFEGSIVLEVEVSENLTDNKLAGTYYELHK